MKDFNKANCCVGVEKVRRIEEVTAKAETDMTLIGVTGVEDKLQPGVRKCLRSLVSAGIQVIFDLEK